ncbi:MAG: tryptophan--tRNA ligase [Actinomycetota bacterium]
MARVFSGVQPTAEVPHLGNYIGAFRNWVELQKDHEAYFSVVDLHSMTVPWDPNVLAQRTRQTAASLIACGIDPERSVLFVQSEVPEHTELAWILLCLSKMGELGRMTQFKDKGAGSEARSIGAGLFVYPILMAADVLAYRAELVPVGDDQRQHLELMRDLAERFNRTFGDTFPVPEPVVSGHGSRIMALDDPSRKMDKSSDRPNNLIWMSDPPDVVRKKIARAVTDSGREIEYSAAKPALSNLIEIYSAVTGTDIGLVGQHFAEKGYAEFKGDLSDAITAFLAPFQVRYAQIMDDLGELDRILEAGANRAREAASETLHTVRERIGLRVT